MDARAHLTTRAFRGRRSRVVLTPRCWRQVGEKCLADDGDNKPRSPGRARYRLLKPLPAGMPGEPGATVVTMLVCFLSFARETAVHRAPGIPHALSYVGRTNSCTTRANHAARSRRCGCGLSDVVMDDQESWWTVSPVIARRETTKQSSFLSQAKMDWFAALAMTAGKTAAAFRRHGREARSSLRATSRPSTFLPFHQ